MGDGLHTAVGRHAVIAVTGLGPEIVDGGVVGRSAEEAFAVHRRPRGSRDAP